MARSCLLLMLILVHAICISYAQFNAGGGGSASGSAGASGSVGAGGSGSVGGSGAAGGSGSAAAGAGGSAAGSAQATYPNPACWMPVKEAPNHYLGPQGRETDTATYAARRCFNNGSCSSHISRFHLQKATLDAHPNVQLLFYPPGSMNWLRKGEYESKEALVLDGNRLLCRYTNKNGNIVIGTKKKSTQEKCMAKVHDKTQSSGNYEVLVFKGCANARVVNATPKNCSSLPDTCPAVGIPEITTTEPSEDIEDEEATDNLEEICWKGYIQENVGSLRKTEESDLGEPLGKEGGLNVYLSRLIWSGNRNGKVAFGKYLHSETEPEINCIGCNKPVSGEYAALELLATPNGAITWRKINQTALLAGLPTNAVVLGSIPGNPYDLGKRHSYHTICQPDVRKKAEDEVPLGVLNSLLGYCEAVFEGKLVHYTAFSIPVQTHGSEIKEIRRCRTSNSRKRRSVSHVLKPVLAATSALTTGLANGLTQCSADSHQGPCIAHGNGEMQCEGYTIPHFGLFTPLIEALLGGIRINSCTTWANSRIWKYDCDDENE